MKEFAPQRGFLSALLPLASLLTLSLGFSGCERAAPPAPPIDAAAAAKTLVDGLGPSRACEADRDCEAGGQRGACVLATCFGVLTTDSRAARRALVARLAAAPLEVRAAALPKLQAALHGLSSGPMVRVAAVESLGALGRSTEKTADFRNQAAELLRRQVDDESPQVAVAVRIELGTLGETAVLPGLLQDLSLGTELLRAESCRGLGGYRGTSGAKTAREALLAALNDRSPVVQAAAFTALSSESADPQVHRALRQLVDERAPHLAYALDKLPAEAPPPQPGR